MESILIQIQQTSLTEWLGTVFGLLGVYLSIKEKVIAWLFFVLCYGLYAYLSFTASLYAAMTLNACFIPISIYGWWKWGMSSTENGDGSSQSGFDISRLDKKATFSVLGVTVVGTLIIGCLLSNFTQGALPYLDAFATTLSFVAQWMLSRKYIENWVAWLIADVAFILLWGIQGYWVAVGMFIVFTLLAVSGFVSWKKEMSKHGY